MAVHSAQPPLSLSNPKLVAVALAAGGRLARTEGAPDGRLSFFIDGLPSDFLEQITNDQITVSARSVISCMESVLSLIAERQRAERRK
jgi:hypothetical protein